MQRRTFFALAATTFLRRSSAQGRLPMLLDSDTANEIDDLYAIVRTLLEPRFDLRGLSSAQWAHHLSGPDTVLRSQRINEDILRLMDRQDLPATLGSEMIVGKPWGGDDPRPSAASALMIREARAMPAGQRLAVVSIGASTNVASAIRLAPDIVPKIRCFLMGGRYDPTKKVWNKDEFNFRRDLNAINLLFNTAGLDLHIMTATTSRIYQFEQEETLRRLQGKGAIWDYLAARWLSHSPNAKRWVMWDLALIEAMAQPQLASEEIVAGPPENGGRPVHVYTAIDHQAMLADWWAVVERAQI